MGSIVGKSVGSFVGPAVGVPVGGGAGVNVGSHQTSSIRLRHQIQVSIIFFVSDDVLGNSFYVSKIFCFATNYLKFP